MHKSLTQLLYLLYTTMTSIGFVRCLKSRWPCLWHLSSQEMLPALHHDSVTGILYLLSVTPPENSILVMRTHIRASPHVRHKTDRGSWYYPRSVIFSDKCQKVRRRNTAGDSIFARDQRPGGSGSPGSGAGAPHSVPVLTEQGAPKRDMQEGPIRGRHSCPILT